MKSGNKLAGIGLLTAFSASLCCITPLLALLAGTSGLASTLSWIDPLRPYLVGLTVFVLGFAWYQKLSPNTFGTQQQIDCNCDTNDIATAKSASIPFIQTKKFLFLVTVFAGLMLAFPLYVRIFYPQSEYKSFVSDPVNIQKTEFIIDGMTCTGCEKHITDEIYKLPGIIKSTVSYKKGNAIIEFDKTMTDIDEIEKAIAKTDYTITDKKTIE